MLFRMSALAMPIVMGWRQARVQYTTGGQAQFVFIMGDDIGWYNIGASIANDVWKDS